MHGAIQSQKKVPLKFLAHTWHVLQ
jgi:hypothetical protein